MQVIKAEGNLETLWKNTMNKCKETVLENIILNGEFNISEIDSDFINLHKNDAVDWQKPKRPKHLIINHGEYINKVINQNINQNINEIKGIDFIINELKKKNCGNRACYSLINMEDITYSKDKPIPSFMILQFSFSTKNKDKLLVSAYFRALEVTKFLPINLSEICMNIAEIKKNFPNINIFELNIFVFRAQHIEDFNCLQHSKLDLLKASEMSKYLIKNKQPLIDALKDKQRIIESVVTTTGMESLSEAISITDEDDLKNKNSVQNEINIILETMRSINIMRENTSIQNQINEKSKKLKKDINKLIVLLESQIGVSI